MLDINKYSDRLELEDGTPVVLVKYEPMLVDSEGVELENPWPITVQPIYDEAEEKYLGEMVFDAEGNNQVEGGPLLQVVDGLRFRYIPIDKNGNIEYELVTKGDSIFPNRVDLAHTYTHEESIDTTTSSILKVGFSQDNEPIYVDVIEGNIVYDDSEEKFELEDGTPVVTIRYRPISTLNDGSTRPNPWPRTVMTEADTFHEKYPSIMFFSASGNNKVRNYPRLKKADDLIVRYIALDESGRVKFERATFYEGKTRAVAYQSLGQLKQVHKGKYIRVVMKKGVPIYVTTSYT